jgi:hypothetical protein
MEGNRLACSDEEKECSFYSAQGGRDVSGRVDSGAAAPAREGGWRGRLEVEGV